MYTIKVVRKTDQRTFEEVFQCRHYKRELIKGKDKEGFQHYLSLYGVEHFDEGLEIDLYKMMEDQYGKYEQDVFVMNDNGKTIDRY